MYHGRFLKSHYEAGYRWGKLLFSRGKIISDNPTFVITEERKLFVERCMPLYQEYYPEILEEIRGIAEGQGDSYENLCIFLLSMYCFEFNNRCTCFAIADKDNIMLGRNSDFLVSLEKLYMNCLYRLEKGYSFNGNTTAFVQKEDGINEYGLAVGFTFVYPTVFKPGLNAGILVRYLLEKCKSTREAIVQLKKLPIASSQTITIADRSGDIVVVECNSDDIGIIEPQKNDCFVGTTNHFNSRKLAKYNSVGIDDWKSSERFETVNKTLKKNKEHYSLNLAKELLSGKYGFMCHYDRSKDADTVWSVIYDTKNSEIFRAEGNPSRRAFNKDARLKFSFY